MISSEPDVNCYDLKCTDEFVIIACDGIWDCVTCQHAVDYLRFHLRNRQIEAHKTGSYTSEGSHKEEKKRWWFGSRSKEKCSATNLGKTIESSNNSMCASSHQLNTREVAPPEISSTSSNKQAMKAAATSWLSVVVENLLDDCLAEDPRKSRGGVGCDNMTCILVDLSKLKWKGIFPW